MKIFDFSTRVNLLATGLLTMALGFTQPIHAQTQGVCGTDEYYNIRVAAHPEILANQHQMDAYIERMRTAQGKTALDVGQEIIVPICFHIIHNNGSEDISDQVIKDEVARLNIDYNKQNSDTNRVRAIFKPLIANPHVTFQLASVDPWGNCTTGIDRVVSTLTTNATDAVKTLDWWDTKHYLNVWVVKSIFATGLPPGETLAGYSHFPWDATADPANDGVLIGYQFIGKNMRVLTHEIGHYFGLYHPFQDGCSEDQNLQGDHVEDTPPVASANINSSIGINSCHTDNPDLPDLVEDYMDYWPSPCMFTTDQVWRLRAFALERSELVSQSNRDTVFDNKCNALVSGINSSNNQPSISFSIFPNPSTGNVTIQTESYLQQTGSICLVDITGKTIFMRDDVDFNPGVNNLSFTREQLRVNADGLYFFRIVVGNSVIQKKIIFQD